MSQANVEVVKRLFESYRRGDYAQAAACLAPDVVYEVGQELPALGRAERPFRRTSPTWGTVLVTVYYSARGRGSGIEYEERLFDVYPFSDGRCVRKREFRERSEAVEAAGSVNCGGAALACGRPDSAFVVELAVPGTANSTMERASSASPVSSMRPDAQHLSPAGAIGRFRRPLASR